MPGVAGEFASRKNVTVHVPLGNAQTQAAAGAIGKFRDWEVIASFQLSVQRAAPEAVLPLPSTGSRPSACRESSSRDRVPSRFSRTVCRTR
jgi:hypothetical protein